MKPFKLLSSLVIFFVFLFSCGGNKEKSKTTNIDFSETTKNDSNVNVKSNIITTPQTIMIVWHKMSDFTKWKASYEAHDSMKLAFGIHNYIIGREVADSNSILVATKVDDIAKAKAFGKDPSVKTAMKKSGVIGTPSISLTTLVYQDTAQNMSPLRSMTTFTVKDWDGWKKSFESSHQIRTDNGLTDRAYGYDVDDNHKITVVVAVNDSAKATAYWNSDLLKQKRAESGVIGEVRRYVYYVVQKY